MTSSSVVIKVWELLYEGNEEVQHEVRHSWEQREFGHILHSTPGEQ